MSDKQLYFPLSKLDQLEKEIKTVPVDGEGSVIQIEYVEEFVRGTILKLISDHRQLLDENQALDKQRCVAISAAEEFESELQALQQEYADERASHNAHVAELLAAEKTIQAQVKEIEQAKIGISEYEFWIKNIGQPAVSELQALREREVRYRKAIDHLIENVQWDYPKTCQRAKEIALIENQQEVRRIEDVPDGQSLKEE